MHQDKKPGNKNKHSGRVAKNTGALAAIGAGFLLLLQLGACEDQKPQADYAQLAQEVVEESLLPGQNESIIMPVSYSYGDLFQQAC